MAQCLTGYLCCEVRIAQQSGELRNNQPHHIQSRMRDISDINA